ncbi:MAG: tetratricopeptide repeat protein [Phycisphaerae bacterium]|nr:tetratricopeptide repeat protein [Phycisphaerae bacterium]
MTHQLSTRHTAATSSPATDDSATRRAASCHRSWLGTTGAIITHFTPRAARALALIVAPVAIALISGCAHSHSASPYSGQSALARDSSRAEALNQQAADLIERDPTRAESLLRDALAADLYHGAAHNNLGTLLLQQGKLYDAAAEFEWARKLLPGHPDPRHNLALTFELAGRYDDALATYAAALDVYPEHLPTIQAMVRLLVRVRKTNERTPTLLDTIALRGETKEWREWARAQRSIVAVPMH